MGGEIFSFLLWIQLTSSCCSLLDLLKGKKRKERTELVWKLGLRSEYNKWLSMLSSASSEFQILPSSSQWEAHSLLWCYWPQHSSSWWLSGVGMLTWLWRFLLPDSRPLTSWIRVVLRSVCVVLFIKPILIHVNNKKSLFCPQAPCGVPKGNNKPPK